MKLREIRQLRGITQDQLEKLTGLDQGHISNIETGIIKRPSWEVVARLSKALGVSAEELFPIECTEQVSHDPAPGLNGAEVVRTGAQKEESA